MTVQEAIQARHSVRAYKELPLADEAVRVLVDKITELNRPSWEFDRIRTCVDKCHKLAPKPLGHKLHINSRWIRTTTSRTGIWYATITPWSCFLVAPEGVEPSLTEPKPVVLPLYHRAIFLWNLVESNHVLRIFSPAHTPSLPKFPFGLPQMDSNHHLQIQNLTC